MRVVKIGAIWCSGCLVMNKVWNSILKKYDFDVLELDYDMDFDEVSKYKPGDILPVFIFLDGNRELYRSIGEVSEKKLVTKIEELINYEKAS